MTSVLARGWAGPVSSRQLRVTLGRHRHRDPGARHDDHPVEAGQRRHRLVGRRLHPDRAAAADRAVGGDQDPGAGIRETLTDGIRAET